MVTLLTQGADPMDRNKDFNQRTPLHLAGMNGCLEVAQVLIANGAEVNARNKV